MLFALAFLPMFGIGGLTGLPLGLAPSDIHLHDTYYVIGHFHYVVAPGTIFALFAGIYYWFPKATGRKMNEMLGADPLLGLVRLHERRLHADVHPGAGGVNRRCTTAARSYAHNAGAAATGTSSSAWRAWTLGLFQIPFIFNFFWSIKTGRSRSTTIRGRRPRSSGRRRRRRGTATSSTEPIVYRGPYEYSVPGAATDFTPQFEPEKA